MDRIREDNPIPMQAVDDYETEGVVSLGYTSEDLDLIQKALVDACGSVYRYKSHMVNTDMEVWATIDYSALLNNPRLEKLCLMISKEQSYSQIDLMYMSLRCWLFYSWKLDVRSIMNLVEIMKAINRYNAFLYEYAEQKIDVGSEIKCPYWLRQARSVLSYCLPDDINGEALKKTEVVMVRTHDIQANCRELKGVYFICLDYGLYFFLYEWARIVLGCYRMDHYMIGDRCKIKLSSESAAYSVLNMCKYIIGQGSITSIGTYPCFSDADGMIAKELVGWQSDYILAHEYSHIGMGYESSIAGELQADKYAIQWLSESEARFSPLKGVDGVIAGISEEERKEMKRSDLLLKNKKDRIIESIELLFVFYDVFYYILQKIELETRGNSFNYPFYMDRILQCRKYYTSCECNDDSFIVFIRSFAEELKTAFDKLVS